MSIVLLLVPLAGYLTQSNFISQTLDAGVKKYYHIPPILKYRNEKNPMLDGTMGNPMERNPKTYYGTPTQLRPARIEGKVYFDDQFYDASLPNIDPVERMIRINEHYLTSTRNLKNNWSPNYSDNRYARISFMPNEALQKKTIKKNRDKGKYQKKYTIASIDISDIE